jgi:aryl-alcohol dehydrogenase-like predicted oxidoreductase
MSRYNSHKTTEAAKRYLEIAEDYNMTLAQMALAFVNRQPFVTSNIIGATTLEQLKENIGSINITLGNKILKAIDTVHSEIPNPAP